MNRKFLIWWMIAVMQSIALGIAFYFGAVQFLIDNDVTRLSFVIILMWLVTTIIIGYRSFKNISDFDMPWFVAESCMTVGMVGTVVGFMLMLGSSFAEIDPSNIESMRQVIIDMASGMSTALLTTLSGLVASLFVKVQVVMQEQKNA
jgi:NAD/NADP transhydrogenase beta subunit